MPYNLYLFDLDDTLLNFKESEKFSFRRSLESIGLSARVDDLYKIYQVENAALWHAFEKNLVTKDFLKVERFRKTFAAFSIDENPELASTRYLEALPETVVLMDYAEEICRHLSSFAEIGIITNGIQSVQFKRIANSKIAPYISFISVSDECGFAKPDIRFFEYTVKKARAFSKGSTLIIGDRMEADILGAINFGIDGCWFNPGKIDRTHDVLPHHEIHHLSELEKL